MAASGNYKTLPNEEDFIPSTIRRQQSQEEMIAELMKLKKE